jgi:nuclear pore complex protein Nup160
MRYTKKDLQHNALKRLVAEMVGKGYATELLALPFAGLKEDVDAILVDGVKREGDGSLTAAVAGGEVLPYYKLLYAWRIRHGDVRGAVSVLVERFEQRKKRGQRKRVGVLASKSGEKERDTVLEEYLVAINALELAGENEGWVLVGGSGGKFGQSEMRQDEKRKVVTLEDVRKGYQEELDRRSVLETGRFGIVGGFGEDDDDEDEMEE